MEVKTFAGDLSAKGKKFAIIVSRFNSLLSESLLKGAIDCLERHYAESVEVIKVPGAFEIPFAAKKAAMSKKYDAIVCLGVIIRGSTPHFDFIAAEARESPRLLLKRAFICLSESLLSIRSSRGSREPEQKRATKVLTRRLRQ